MSPSIISSFPIILLISSIIFISSPKTIVATPSLVQKACSKSNYNDNTYTELLCLRTLQFTPSITSAKDPLSLSIAIIESGISNSTKMLAHAEHMLERTRSNSRERDGFKRCKSAYDQVVNRFKSALNELRGGDYEMPTYDLLTASTDCIEFCESALMTYKIEDHIIMRGNQIVPIFGKSAYSVIEDLKNIGSPPPYHH